MYKDRLYLPVAKVIFLLFVFSFIKVNAKEGMWLPPLLQQYAADMKLMGLQIPVEKLYNDNGTGLNNAVVIFGKGCSGEIISSKGLILTNHHCGYGTVQGLSSPKNDYFANGFWAKNMQEEIPCPGLTITFIRKMEDVTDKILTGLPDTLSDIIRDSIIAIRVKNLQKGYEITTHMDAAIKSFYNGNQYWVTISETYRDVRLVGFPPDGIGSFGGDAENWSWPRHTGDFSLFRVYAGPDNKPADYSKNNKPYHTTNFFTINTNGYKEGDFSMVYGFPYITQEYISSYQLNHVYSIIDPIAVDVRTKKLDIWNKNMEQSRDIFLEYTSKRAGVANGWKKWQGELHGLQINNVIGNKETYEKSFQAWAVRDSALPYAQNLLPQIEASSVAVDSTLRTEVYIREAVLGIELIQEGAALDNMLKHFRTGLPQQSLDEVLEKDAEGMHGFYKNYDANVDKQVFSALMPLFFNNCSSSAPMYYKSEYQQFAGNYNDWANKVYSISMIANEGKLDSFATHASPADSNIIMSDPAWQLYNAINNTEREKALPILTIYSERIQYLNRLYMKSQMEKDKNTKAFYPDANFTLRLSYGKIKGIDPEGPAGYSYQTNLDEAIALDNPNEDEFRVPQKLKDLYNTKNYGRWAVNGTVPIAFLSDNHTSGGNSGSPVLNAKGELIGTNFDRVWEGTMSDYYFDPNQCRNISLDIRYTLFIIDKFGDAGWLLKEMKFVKK